jgi:basic membrane protein A
MTSDSPGSLTAAALFAGRIDDGGFMEAGYRGLLRARDELGFAVHYADRTPPLGEPLVIALRELASAGAPLVIAHGGQNNEAGRTVAAEFPDTRFVVTQGNVAGANLASYDVLQEQSAFLAGAAAGLLTRSQVVGHISGIRVVPGLKGRAAFAAGLKATNPGAKLLTTFCGAQDDVELARRTALAEIDAGADIIFTMLNAGIAGATAACRSRGIRQIGNVVDWVARAPDAFVGSAIAEVGMGVFLACRDLKEGRWRGGAVRRIGLEDPAAVRLVLAPDVPGDVRAAIDRLGARIVAGEIEIPERYAGPELTLP